MDKDMGKSIMAMMQNIMKKLENDKEEIIQQNKNVIEEMTQQFNKTNENLDRKLEEVRQEVMQINKKNYIRLNENKKENQEEIEKLTREVCQVDQNTEKEENIKKINSIDENISYVSYEDNSCVKGGTEYKLPNDKELNDVFDNLNTLVLTAETKNENGSLGKSTEASYTTTLDSINSSFMMNNSSIFMGGQDDKMSLQKAGLDNVLNLLKDKPRANTDQMFNNLSSFSKSDLGGTSDISQNVDEIMQVIKSREVYSLYKYSNAAKLEQSKNIEITLNLCGGRTIFLKFDLKNLFCWTLLPKESHRYTKLIKGKIK